LFTFDKFRVRLNSLATKTVCSEEVFHVVLSSQHFRAIPKTGTIERAKPGTLLLSIYRNEALLTGAQGWGARLSMTSSVRGKRGMASCNAGWPTKWRVAGRSGGPRREYCWLCRERVCCGFTEPNDGDGWGRTVKRAMRLQRIKNLELPTVEWGGGWIWTAQEGAAGAVAFL
jgi:hypothetical protein